MLEPIWYLLTWLAVTLRLYIGVPWLYLNKWLAAPLRIINHKPMHRIAVIGDGFAEGVGDWTTVMVKSGLAHHLDKAIEARGAARHPWVSEAYSQACAVVLLLGSLDGGSAEERNEAIREELEALDASAPIVFVDYPELTASDVCFDGMHPSSGGYSGLAAVLASELEPVMMSVEVGDHGKQCSALMRRGSRLCGKQ
ncbi:hypothetical protein FNF29_08398 [Cafeteria roenbergensis]|uniref:SGNH hydrolase-type esterase domain-containing protein n=1 Tax=Cafeteria roenbergensis TaxID=33653 RepID=A0A5A8BYR3_CAFRO|nr:hypothetical protein FNF29_08398 [Cafeteria roenbergensis]|eukprot:KAA0145778.1 hypothetical protein FNF29_08398 [Cafeteria roenbergensis]